jgi:hypothetical protein
MQPARGEPQTMQTTGSPGAHTQHPEPAQVSVWSPIRRCDGKRRPHRYEPSASPGSVTTVRYVTERESLAT